MTTKLLLLIALLCHPLLLPRVDAVYYYYSSRYYYSYSYYSYSYYGYSYSSSCSTGCIAGAVVGGLVFLGLLIGLGVFFLCYCKAAKKHSVQPAVFTTSARPVVATSEGAPSYPTQPYPQPPSYDQSQMYPPVGSMYPPPNVMVPDTAYPPGPPPAYPAAAESTSQQA